MIRVYDEAGTVIETRERAGDFSGERCLRLRRSDLGRMGLDQANFLAISSSPEDQRTVEAENEVGKKESS